MKRLLLTALLLLAFECFTAHAQQLTATLGSTGPGSMAVQWNALGGNYVYAVSGAASLTDGTWRYVDDVDAWPQTNTSHTVSTNHTCHFLRVHGINRGQFVTNAPMHSMTVSQINGVLFLRGLPMTATSDVTVYRLVYETFDHRGLSVLASGALAVPTTPGPGATGPLVSLQHGTVFLKSDAPSEGDQTDLSLAYMMAGEGYIVALPDFPGLGSSSAGLHSYVHARSEAVASVDMLRAARTFLAAEGRIMPGAKLFIAGYSQGGHATMALHRELEQHHAAEFPLTASAPMAGPYDLSGTMSSSMTLPVAYDGREYVPYLLFAYDAVYGLYDDVSDVLVAPYATTLPPLFDGLNSASTIDAAMPRVPRDIFQPAWITDFETNPSNPLRTRLEDNDLHTNWTPQAPMRLYHCSGDEVVPFANSVVAASNFVARGAGSVQVVDMGALSHSDGAAPCSLAAKAWFDTLR